MNSVKVEILWLCLQYHSYFWYCPPDKWQVPSHLSTSIWCGITLNARNVKFCGFKIILHSLHLKHLDLEEMEWWPRCFLVYILAIGSKLCVYPDQCKCEDWGWSLIVDLSLTWKLTCEGWSIIGSRLSVPQLPWPQT